MKNEKILAQEYVSYRSDILVAVDRVLMSGRYILGKEVARFEKRFAEYTGAKYCVAVGNGYDALQLSIRICFEPWSTIKVINEKHVATTNAIGASSVLLHSNCDNVGGLIIVQPYHKELFINEKTPYIEDCCQALGVHYDSKHVGNFGLAGCFSFHPLKSLHCYGDGGAVITNNKEIYDKLLVLRNHGRNKEGKYVERGCNSRLDEVQAAILNVFMNHINSLVTKVYL